MSEKGAEHPLTIRKPRRSALKRLIFAICVMLLASGCAHIKETKTEVLSKCGASWDGSVLPAYPAGKPEITILKITIPPGTRLPMHTHPVINAGFLVSGELIVITEDNRKLHLKAGDSLIEVVDKWHYGKNEGSSPAVIIVFYAGTTDSPITIKK
jgi:quercetin dioxygenase-like cupin family protein